MRALILAAGLGTRLRPLTKDIPKALLRVGDLTLLERAIFYLEKNGVKEIALNSHYLANKITDFLSQRKDLKIQQVFFENELLDTGGAIKNAKNFLCDSEPFIVFNADILTNIDLRAVINKHKKTNALATLLANNRPTSRPLLVDNNCRLIGHWDKKNNLKKLSVNSFSSLFKEVGFLGIHIISPKIFSLMPELDKFGVVDWYLDLVNRCETILVEEQNEAYWIDVGTMSSLQKAENYLKNGLSLN